MPQLLAQRHGDGGQGLIRYVRFPPGPSKELGDRTALVPIPLSLHRITAWLASEPELVRSPPTRVGGRDPDRQSVLCQGNRCHPGGSQIRRTQTQEDAADDFNEERVRFLVSTEAGGEGIDLQQRCATLVHVDLPWNPMRLHQRVGRLWRCGQTRDVTAYILRNPQTVEARIWDLLDEKLRRIQRTLSASMSDPEDAMQLVLGIANPSALEPLFTGAPRGGDLRRWFDAGSSRLSDESVLDFVRRMLGNVERFDFGRDGDNVPKLDLPDLEPFFVHAVQRHGLMNPLI